jgi:hypothetical protein
MVYVDATRPEFVEGFTKKTFTAMIEGIREPAIRAGLLDQHIFERGIRDLYRTTEPDGVFCYTFFKAFAEKWRRDRREAAIGRTQISTRMMNNE